ncbi:hypothetical protein BI347_21855 [Chromobacterium sphagni]|uniref:DUF2165 domain-containing protein n=1 Tax=Chromobacterium sphagni TaxID=1903179 RepID=A0A1S1WTJ8_9NEIS|nr:DUF2165 domain-containing protein [Chromobacterium sphagni]OHX10425.1 hypothetical protein BI347_21855 [Chromobacterium sphagni]
MSQTSCNIHLRIQYLCKGALALSIGAFGLLAAIGNIIDYQSNWQFVRHVLAMDSMEPWFDDAVVQGRAVTDPFWQRLAYLAIIAGELACGLLCAAGGTGLAAAAAGTGCLRWSKSLFTLGALLAILVWYFGFAVVGGEYFAMWANKWNGQMKAYAFISFIVISLIYIRQPERAD